ncbi:DEAD/DEAH box helicase [Vulcanisaeta thermophila]|uniref:DEAD/DEAH box helicase n=1 Tax=Vulcanisaeta thermophila TaxID=867917 RepID=UPI000853EB0D|nr:DEAD/DEAH box helicase [Vulcanisaeta thermophila]
MDPFWSKHLTGELVRVLERYGYEEPTPIQRKAIPQVLTGKNTLIIAPTGSGKTEAAMLPVISEIIRRGLKNPITTLYITPARALNRDVNIRLSQIANELGITTAVRHGDTPESERRRQVRNPPMILITTPETLQVILTMKAMRRHLKHLRWVVVDEIHELINDERGAQLAIALERLVNIAGEFQRIGLSATVGNPELTAKYLAGTNREATIVIDDTPRSMEIKVELPQPTEDDVKNAEELNTTPETMARIRRIIEIINQHKTTLIFTNTRDEAELLGHRLMKILGPDKIGVYHGSLDKEEREELERKLRNGEVKAVVTTSSLELGIDIGLIEAVIQYSSPRQTIKIIQRIGRSGHTISKKAIGYIITRNTDDYLESKVITEKALKGEIEREVEYHEKALDVLQHQIAGIIIDTKTEGRNPTIEWILETVKRAHPYRDLTKEELMEVIKFMEQEKLVKVDNEEVIPRRGLHKYYYENISMIPDQKHYKALDITTQKTVGELDEEFVETTEPGTPIILAGKPWRVISIDRENTVVNLEPITQSLNTVPTWIGEEIPVPTDIAQETCKERQEIINKLRSGEEPDETPTPIIEELKQQANTEVTEFTKTINIEWRGKDLIIHACLGTKGNQALALYISRYIGTRYKTNISTATDPYRVLITAPINIPPKTIEQALQEDPKTITETLKEAIRETRLYRYRFIHVARKHGVLPKEKININIDRLIKTLENTIVDKETIREILTEKIDQKPLIDLTEKIKNKQINIKIIETNQYTPLAQHILETNAKYDAIITTITTTTLINIIKTRIQEKQITLLCLNCGWNTTTKVKYTPNDIKCPRCGMRIIAVLKYGEDPRKMYEITRKAKKKLPMTSEEKQKWEELTETANAVLQYGKKAIIALAAHGVGPATVIRKVLARAKTEEELYQQILQAEREYYATKPFWEH